jgi:hypothetical protein
MSTEDIVRKNQELQEMLKSRENYYVDMMSEIKSKLGPGSDTPNYARADVEKLRRKIAELQSVAHFYPSAIDFSWKNLYYYDSALTRLEKEIQEREDQQKIHELEQEPAIASFVKRVQAAYPAAQCNGSSFVRNPSMIYLLEKAVMEFHNPEFHKLIKRDWIIQAMEKIDIRGYENPSEVARDVFELQEFAESAREIHRDCLSNDNTQ